MRAASLGLACLLLMNGAAMAAPKAVAPAPAIGHVGAVPVSLRAPPGLLDPTSLGPAFGQLATTLTPPSNRLLAIYVTPEDFRAHKAGKKIVMDRYALLQTPRQAENLTVVAADFAQLKEVMKNQSAAQRAQVRDMAEHHIGNAVSKAAGTPLTVSMTDINALGTFLESDTALGLLSATDVSAAAHGRTINYPLVYATGVLRVKERLLFLYTYSVYRTPADLEWVKTTATAWSRRLQQAN